MTTPETFAKTPQVRETFVFPDPPEDPDDKMTSFDHLTITGTAHALAVHLGHRETTLVAGEHYLALTPTRSLAGVRYPDLLVAFEVNPEAYRQSNAYVVSEQGKPPDLAMEIVSSSSGRVDRVEKRVDYARLGISEYWRFDEKGRSPEERLAGDRLVDGEYVPVDVEELENGSLQGYSTVLNLYLRWDAGALVFCDPATGSSIATLETERSRADAADAHAQAEHARAEAERQAREAAEARVRELEEQFSSQEYQE